MRGSCPYIYGEVQDYCSPSENVHVEGQQGSRWMAPASTRLWHSWQGNLVLQKATRSFSMVAILDHSRWVRLQGSRNVLDTSGKLLVDWDHLWETSASWSWVFQCGPTGFFGWLRHWKPMGGLPHTHTPMGVCCMMYMHCTFFTERCTYRHWTQQCACLKCGWAWIHLLHWAWIHLLTPILILVQCMLSASIRSRKPPCMQNSVSVCLHAIIYVYIYIYIFIYIHIYIYIYIWHTIWSLGTTQKKDQKFTEN